VQSMWLWHDQWVPAMSDIDLQVIIRRGLKADREYCFLEYFWKTFDRLRRFFPMLEVRILSEDELPVWLSYGTSGHPDLSPVLLRGTTNAALQVGRSPLWRQVALSFALWVYIDMLPPCFAVPDSFLRRQDVQRRIRKIVRLLKPILSEAGQECGAVDPVGVADAVLALERSIAHLDLIAPADDAKPGWLHEDADGRVYSPAGFPALNGVRGVIRTATGKVLIIAEDGLDRETLGRIIEASQRQWSGTTDAPVVLPRSVFVYLIRINSPRLYSGLVSERAIIFGTDPLADVAPPSRGALAAHTLSRIAHALTFTRCETVLSRSVPLSLADCESSLNGAMAVRLLLRDNWSSPRRRETEARWRSEFPECAIAFDRIKLDAAEGREKSAREGMFHLFRLIARDILDRAGSLECGGAAVAAGRLEKE